MSCVQNLHNEKCPKCLTAWKLLPCAVCRTHFKQGEDVLDTYTMYESNLPYRTPCCAADRHKTCIDDSMDKCPICNIPWNEQGEVDHERMLGPDYMYMVGNRWKNDGHRSHGTHYFIQPKWGASSSDATQYIDLSCEYVPTVSPLRCSTCGSTFDECVCSECDSDFSGDGNTSPEQHNSGSPSPDTIIFS